MSGAEPRDVSPDDAKEADAPPPADRQGWLLLGISCALYLVLFCVFYPPTHAIEDEVGFLNTATIWSRGALTAEGAGLEDLSETTQGPRGRVGWRNIGRSILTAPALALFGYRASFFVGALIHVLLALVGGLVLRRLGRSAAWALLLLWHPSFLLYSRAVMADELCALCLVLAAWGILSKRHVVAGLALGFAVVARYHVGLSIPAAVLAVLWVNGRGAALRTVAGGALVAAGLASYNLALLGSPLGATGQGHFSLGYLAENVVHFTTSLMILWPGLLLAPFAWLLWRWGRRGEHVNPEVDARGIVLLSLALPLFFTLLVYYFFDAKGGPLPRRVVLGQRLLLPAIPAWIFLYALVLTRECPGDLLGLERRERLLRLLAPLVAVAGFAGGGLLMARHQRYLSELVTERERASSVIPEGSLVIGNRHFTKLLEVPDSGVPSYRLSTYAFHGRLLEGPFARALAERRNVYLVHLRRRPGEPLPDAWAEAISRLGGDVVYGDDLLIVRRVRPRPLAPPEGR